MMMDAYGTCPQCKGEGALWIVRRVPVRKFWLFGSITMRPVYRCDECASQHTTGESQ